MNDLSGTSWLGQPIDARPLFGTELGALLETLLPARAARGDMRPCHIETLSASSTSSATSGAVSSGSGSQGPA